MVGEEELREAVVARPDGEPGVAVVRLDERDDLAALLGVARRLDRDVDCLAACCAVDHALHVGGAGLDQRLGERGARQGRKVMVAHVEVLHGLFERRDQLGVAMAEVVRTAVEMHVDQPSAGHVPEVVALAAIDHEVDASVLPEVGLVGIPERTRALQHVLFRLVREESVVVHTTPFSLDAANCTY